MERRRNVKRAGSGPRKRKKKKATGGYSRAKTTIIALVLGGLSAFGLWQCFDKGGESPLAPAQDLVVEKEIDLGEGKTPDPTLVNEQALLLAESKPSYEGSEPGEEEQPPAKVDEEEQLTIDEAGEAVPEEDLEEKFPMHAVAYHFHTQVLEKPESGSRVIGYARRGSTFRVSERVSTKGCKRGWHELQDGGFVCDGTGVNVSDKPVTFAPAPPKPKLDSPLPYDYMYAKENGVPEFWRTPNEEEIRTTQEIFDRLARRDSGEENAPEEKLDTEALASVLAKAAAIAGESPDAGVAPAPAPVPEPAKVPETPTTLADGGVIDPYKLPAYVHLRMAKGYFVSAADKVKEDNNTYRRTVRGRYIPNDKLYPAKPTSNEGVLVNASNPLPMAFVIGGGVKLLQQEEEGGPLKAGEKIARYSRLPYLGEMKRRSKRYAQVGEKLFLPERVVAVARQVDPPEDLVEGERWIDIDLSEQTLVAYEGATPVFATLISTGRKGFETPTGSFRVYGKHVTITMDDPDGGEEAYSIEDVPWTQYFEEGYALHAAFWHDRFGRVRSHGCVNLSPADARRLFFWTGPHVQTGLHGTIATRENPGTRIVIHK